MEGRRVEIHRKRGISPPLLSSLPLSPHVTHTHTHTPSPPLSPSDHVKNHRPYLGLSLQVSPPPQQGQGGVCLTITARPVERRFTNLMSDRWQETDQTSVKAVREGERQGRREKEKDDEEDRQRR